jgi:long-chain acyl-CoA synthetase
MLDWWGPRIYEYYAATEGNGYTFIGPDEWRDHEGSVGRAMIGTPHIVDDDGNECPVGMVGTVFFDGTGLFEYHNDPDKTAEARDVRGWTTTGDIGYLDGDGYLYLTDRKSFTIISGGVNIYPQEIENLLLVHPAVFDAAVFGVPDPEFGEQVMAVVQLVDPGGASDELAQELITYCRTHLAHYKCPKSVDFVDALPRQENGKLYKRLLRDQYWGAKTSRII